MNQELNWQESELYQTFEGAFVRCKYKKENGKVVVHIGATSCSVANISWSTILVDPTPEDMHKYVKKVFTTFGISFIDKETKKKLDWEKFSFKQGKDKLTKQEQGFELNSPDADSMLKGFFKTFDDLGFEPAYGNKIGTSFIVFLLTFVIPLHVASGGGA